MALGAVGLALAFIEADSRVGVEALARWPRFFGASAEGARGILSTISGSMITVACVTFSLTIVALSIASNQYTPRILRNFMRDRTNQVVLGIFVSVFLYSLVVLRTIRGGEEAFVPSLSVLFAIVLAMVGIGFLIYFIHHIATSIQASSIIAAIAVETTQSVIVLFPEEVGKGVIDPGVHETGGLPADGSWAVVPAPATGYIQSADPEALLAHAEEHGVVLRMERGIGEFVIVGSPLASLAQSRQPTREQARAIHSIYAIGNYRTVGQDLGFGIRLLVDIALKALSPGVNDTTTATTCIDHLGAVLYCLAGRRIPSPLRHRGGELRLIARGPTFDGMVDAALHEIRQSAGSNVAVLLRLLETLASVITQTGDEFRRRSLWRHAELIAEEADRHVHSKHDRFVINNCLTRVAQELGRKSPLPLLTISQLRKEESA